MPTPRCWPTRPASWYLVAERPAVPQLLAGNEAAILPTAPAWQGAAAVSLSARFPARMPGSGLEATGTSSTVRWPELTDGGVHWSEYALPAPFQPAPDGIAAQSPTSAVVLAGTGHRRFLLQSTDGGDSWVHVATSATLLGVEQGTCTLDGVSSGSAGV